MVVSLSSDFPHSPLCAAIAALTQPQSLSLNAELQPTQGTTPDGQGPLMFDEDRAAEERKGLDLATTLERIQKNFVITDPRLPDNPIVSAEHLVCGTFSASA